jgi:hypothetical protein
VAALLIAALAVLFAVLGAFLGFLGGLALLVIEKMTGGTFNDRTWAYGLFIGISVVVAYVLESVINQWASFGSLHASAC